MDLKNFEVAVSMCEENNKCYKFEVKSKFKKNDISHIDHELFVLVDLLQLGFDKEFHLKADTVYSGKTFKHDFETRLKSKENVQYVYKVYVDQSKANVELVLPKRTMALEGVYKLPVNSVLGTYEISITSFMDKKNQPTNKAILGLFGNIQLTDNKLFTTSGEFKFAHPSLKELRISGKSTINKHEQKATGTLEIDVFNTKEQTIIVSGGFENVGSNKDMNLTCHFDTTSQGLQLNFGFDAFAAASLNKREVSASSSLRSGISDLNFRAYVFGAEDKAILTINGLNEEIVNIVFDHQNSQKTTLKAKVNLFGSKPFIADFSASDLKSFRANFVRDKLFNINGEVTLGKAINLNVNGASNTEIFKGKIALDETSFLASEYNVNENEFKSFVVR